MLRSLLCVALVLMGLIGPLPAAPAAAFDPIAAAAARPDFFGIVGRDPLYSLDVGRRVIAQQPPLDFLERMAAEIAGLGAKWIRIEFHAESDSPSGPGTIDYAKYDQFIRVIAPRHGLKVLALLNSGIVTDTDPYYWLPRLEDPADRAGGDPTDLSNNYIRVFRDRSGEIAARYRGSIAAYEVFNEPNVNTHKLILFQGKAQEISSERLGALATDTALAIKQQSPGTPVILGGLLHGAPVEKPGRIPSDYLAEVYLSPRVQWFFREQPLGASQPFPWDGVALHPYDLTPEQVETHVREIKARMESVGDRANRIWITEVGMQAEPAPIRTHWLMEPTLQEQQQADYLLQIYSRLLVLPEIVERVFWFKYEDFRENGLPRNWGIVRLREGNIDQYDPNVVPYPRKPAYSVYQRLANGQAFPLTPARSRATKPGDRYFPAAGQAVGGVFLRYWDANGGLARFGLPRSAAFWQGGRLVQYFERARFEHFPEYGGTANEVQLGLLGLHLVESGRLTVRAAAPEPRGPNTRFFPETRFTIANGFKAYWEQNGGVTYFGLPITGEVREVNPADGQEYTVQYFERARFEYHPRLRGTPHEIQLGLLGNEILAGYGWYR
jgi:hypothetical protein